MYTIAYVLMAFSLVVPNQIHPYDSGKLKNELGNYGNQ